MSSHNTRKFKVAAAQAGQVLKDAPVWFDAGGTLDKAVGLIEEAGKNGARLIVFPECWLPCFPYWSLDYKDRTAFVDIWAKLLECSIEVPGVETEALCSAARRANTYVVMGINERDRKYQGRMYNSILYISAYGEIMGTHRKICNTVQERFFHTPGDGGDNLKTVFPTEIGIIGGSMCGEHSQMLLMHSWIMQGVQVHCSLWPGRIGLETITDISTRSLCNSGSAYAVLASTYISKEDEPKHFYSNSVFGFAGGFRGGSGIVNPHGEYIAGPVFDREELVYGDVDLAETDKARYAANLAGIYSRWDLLNVNVREEIYEPLVPMNTSGAISSGQEIPRLEKLEATMKELESQVARLKDKDTGQ
ncbi:MAG: nitrilase-related carbon-nitrogen hydrolase [Dehalococcoidia bacterium]|nr:nitrilase-related carbon-nitrogen hydrolase [Dehalococcoidia bacterium]